MSSATITWTTDQLADSLVEYGTTTSYGSSAADSSLAANHMIILSSLTPATVYHFRVTSKNSYGISSSSDDNSFATPANSIILVITFPLDNDTIPRSDTLVKGTVTNSIGSETGVVVNGFIANVYGNEFVANHVPLVEGSNTITALATDVNGNTQTASVTVNVTTPADYIKLTATPESGIAPLETILGIESSFDFTNSYLTVIPGSVECFSTSHSEYRARMTTKGLYYFTAEVTDSNGNVYTDTVGVTVLSASDLDDLLRAKWEWMRANLATGDIERALVLFDDSTKQDYRDLFNVLSTMLPTVAQEMSDIQLIEYTGGSAIFDIRTTREGTEYSFQLLFTRDLSGIWRITSF